jgi:hypothetical protein
MKITTLGNAFRAGSIIICLVIASLWLLSPKDAFATGGAFPYAKHGGGTTDGETPYNVGNGPGVDRSVNPDYGTHYNDQAVEAGKYRAGECTHCHEPHASFGESEPAPNSSADAGPDPYLLMKEYATSTNYAELCWYCHENFSNINGSGSPLGYGRWTFYQGKNVYQNSSHYTLSANMYWPGTSGDPWTIWPRKSRGGLPAGNKGSCLNCHTPHGIKSSGSGTAFDTSSPDGTGGVPANMQTVSSGNPSVNADYLIPRQLISWEETLCERCHDPSGPSNRDIQTEINKRYLSGGSGHPVDDTSLAGRHTAAENTEVTQKHVECYDCHNPHAVKAPTGVKGDGDAGRLQGMRYVDINGTPRNPATGDRQPYVMEVCFRCHGDTWDQVFAGNVYPTQTQNRPDGRSNKRLEFDPNGYDPSYGPSQSFNSAYHPVAAPGKNTSLALCLQLQNAFGLNCSSAGAAKTSLQNLTINCTDCHNSEALGGVSGPVTESSLRTTDVNSNYGGASMVGPHGSTINTPALNFNSGVSDNGDRSILRDYYFTGTLPTDRSPFTLPSSDTEFQNRFKLCFNCHDWNTFRGNNDNTNFYRSGGMGPNNLHAFHLRGVGGGGMGWNATYEACMICHYNIHSNVQATNTQYDGGSGSLAPDGDTHLVNFAPGVVKNYSYPKPSLRYYNGSMYCNLRCHGAVMTYSYTCSHSVSGGTTDTCNDN